MGCSHFVILAIVAIYVPTLALATEYVVGDHRGWTVNFDYKTWTEGKVFYVGDKLIFNYNPDDHNVFKVNATAFNNCIVPPLKEALKTGNDLIPLTTPGNKWYICGNTGHCSDLNQKLALTVSSDKAPETPPPEPVPVDPSSAHGIVTTYQLIVLAVIMVLANLAVY